MRPPVPPLIKGGWQLAGGHGPVDRAAAVVDMVRFAEHGITAFDCADIYTGVESLIGDFLRAWRARGAEATPVRVHTKFVPDLAALPTLRHADVERAVDRSLARLGVDAIDLVQLHWWDFDIPGFVETTQSLDRLRSAGKLREVGLTNCDLAHVRAAVEAGVPVATHQLQFSVLDRRAGGAMADYCRQHGIALLCYGTLAGGFLSGRWLDAAQPEPPLENRSLTKYELIIREFGGWELFQRMLTVLSGIGQRHAVSVGTVALRWVLDQPGVRSVIVGARHSRSLPATLAALALTLRDEDRAAIAGIQALAPGPAGEVYALERDREGPHGRIMRYNLNSSR
jgi:aryl-alcohol dehydrogenase-like predicted oxidoreductase